MHIAEHILLVPECIYTAFVVYLLYIVIYRSRTKNAPPNQSAYDISIVIPCKNEAHNLPALLASLANQQFVGAFEVIIVDDRSTDTTSELTTTIAGNSPMSIRCIPSGYSSNTHLTGKQQAIEQGMREARFDHVLLTDADMVFSPYWMQSFSNSLKTTTDLMYGHTVIKPDGTAFTALQSFLLEFLFSIAAVFHHAGIAGSCMGNNLLIKKSSYIKSGGFAAIGYTITEDRALLYHFLKRGYTTDIVTPFHPFAYTLPHTTISGYLDQLLRWLRGGMNSGKSLLIIALLFSLQNISFMLIFFGRTGLLFTGIVISNFICTWIMITLSFRSQKAPLSPRFFPLFYLLLIAGTIFLPIFSLTKQKLRWKDTPI